jgi:hypothetical protein
MLSINLIDLLRGQFICSAQFQLQLSRLICLVVLTQFISRDIRGADRRQRQAPYPNWSHETSPLYGPIRDANIARQISQAVDMAQCANASFRDRKSALAALRDFDPAYCRFGADHDLAVRARMPASTGCGHAVAKA